MSSTIHSIDMNPIRPYLNSLKRLIKDQRYFLFLGLVSSLLVACNGSPTEDTTEEANDQAIIITKSQFENEKMAFGQTELQTFDKSIETSGLIEAPANASALISSFISGTIASFAKKPGERVTKGEAIIELKSSQFIELQQEYQETAIKLKNLAIELKRIQNLQAEQITSKSNLQTIEAEYKTLEIKQSALKAKLSLLQIDPNKIETGIISSSLWLRSPVNGYITSLHAVIGQYIEPGITITSVVDISQMQLKFFLYEKDVAQLSQAKKVIYNMLDTPEKQYKAEIINIGKQIDPETHKLICYAKTNPDDIKNMPNGAFAKIKVINSDYKALCLPEQALVKEGNKNYIITPIPKITQDPGLVLEKEGKIALIKTEVTIGETDNGFVEILSPNLAEKWILVKGGGNL